MFSGEVPRLAHQGGQNAGRDPPGRNDVRRERQIQIGKSKQVKAVNRFLLADERHELTNPLCRRVRQKTGRKLEYEQI